jgi:cyclopropane fatty-acyl-phospholipid synthase-like methyltransferase
MTLVEKLDKRWYPNHRDDWDAHAFRARILSKLDTSMTLLDIGAGRGGTQHMNFKDLAGHVIGADLDPVVLENKQIDEAIHNVDGSLTGVADNSVDIVVSKDVLEHVATPEIFFKEVARVLKSGGLFMAKTPNGFHYVTLGARMTPLSFHKWYNEKRGRKSHDTFPTTYLCNSKRALTKLAKLSGMTLEKLEYEEGRPEYLRFNGLTYLIGFLYERTVNTLNLNGLKVSLYVTMRKDG